MAATRLLLPAAPCCVKKLFDFGLVETRIAPLPYEQNRMDHEGF
jgi:hypothetical protein